MRLGNFTKKCSRREGPEMWRRTYPECMQHHAARTPVSPPLAPREVVVKLLVMVKRLRDINEPMTPLDR